MSEDKTNMSSQQYYFDGDKCFNNSYMIKKLSKRYYLVELDKKDVFVNIGDNIDTCYLISKGSIIAYEYSDGNRHIVDWFEEKNLLFSDYAVLNRPSQFYYEALEPTQMYSIKIEKVESLIKTDKRFAQCFIQQLTRNYLVTQDLFRKATTHKASWLTSDFLLVSAARSGKNIDGKFVVHQKISQKLLADLLHINRVTVLREIHKLREMNLIAIKDGYVEIQSIEKLKEYRDNCGT